MPELCGIGAAVPDPLSVPDGLRARGPGRRFWRDVTRTYEGWQPHELLLLAEACRIVDELEELRGASDAGSRVERRALRTELRRTIGQLGLPDVSEAADSDDEVRAQRERQASRRAQHAANVRWSREVP